MDQYDLRMFTSTTGFVPPLSLASRSSNRRFRLHGFVKLAMKFVNGFLFLPFVQIVIGAPLLKTREVVPVVQDAKADESYGIFYTGPGCPPSKPCQLTSSHWEHDLDLFEAGDLVALDRDSHLGSPNNDVVTNTDLAVRSSSDLVIHGRSAAKLQKAGDGLKKAGSVLGKVAKGADAIPEVGEIIGTAIQVVASFLKFLGSIFGAIAKAERESAAARGEFTQKVTDQTLKKHPGWLVVTVHPKHTTWFQGNEHTDWSHSTTSIKTATGTYHFDVYAARAGIFMNDGDGGYMNWAYSAPAAQLKAVGYQNHRLVYTGGAPKNHPNSGNCAFHVYQFQKNEKKQNPVNHYTIVAIIKDAKGVIVGFEGDGDGSKPVPVSSQLHDPLTITTGPNDKSALSFSFGKDKWNSDAKSRCSVGKYDHGIRQMDCNFQCKF
ncbi:hypothetical protein DFH05DRAFT_1516325 [Lentinula detonsa]|uniref:Uncharacterized protein n=1 Tax=Lentinula detonsa TaxID=2804962 RepID=A0A9W8NQ84_9AGAR|nr:hypothetical protein DFH05DRAFT_1516325 [Lentinula detonsa]